MDMSDAYKSVGIDCNNYVSRLLYFYRQQVLYKEGHPSVWGYWNRMAEYLMSPYRRIIRP